MFVTTSNFNPVELIATLADENKKLRARVQELNEIFDEQADLIVAGHVEIQQLKTALNTIHLVSKDAGVRQIVELVAKAYPS